MYKVLCDNILMYDDIYFRELHNAISPRLKLSENTSGMFEVILPISNPCYDKINKMMSRITILKDGKDIWGGRVIEENIDFQKNKHIICEGDFAYFNDTTQPPKEFTDITVYDALLLILEEHNQKVLETDHVILGAVTVDQIVNFTTNFDSTMEVLLTNFVDQYGGYFRIRRELINGIIVKYLDYLETYVNTNSQVILFGENMLDFTSNWQGEEYCSVVVPLGVRLENPELPNVDTRLDVSSVYFDKPYIFDRSVVIKQGWIEKVLIYEDVDDPNELVTLGLDYLNNTQFEEITIDISAVDLSYINPNYNAIELLDLVRCKSEVHGMNTVFPVTEMDIQFDKPEAAKYHLGKKIKTNTITSAVKQIEKTVTEQIKNLPSEASVLEKAKNNATEIINTKTQGYVSIVSNASRSESLVISSDLTYNSASGFWSEDTKLWKFTVNGLGYSTDGGRTIQGPAMTMDGGIVADFITIGTMSADRIRTGILEDTVGNSRWDLNNGLFTMKKGSIQLGISSSFPTGRFSVDDTGYLKCEYGIVGGFRISASSIYNDVIDLNSNGLSFFEDGNNIGGYNTQYWASKPTAKGLTMNLSYETAYTSWAYQQNATSNNYTIKLMYTSQDLPRTGGGNFVKDRVHFACDVDYNNWTIYSASIDPNTSFVNNGATVDNGEVIRLGIVNSRREVTGYIDVKIKNGFILGD